MIWPFWKLFVLVAVGETLAIGVNVWMLCDHWNDPWWSFVPKAINLALLCGAATIAGCALRRAWRLDKEWKDTQ